MTTVSIPTTLYLSLSYDLKCLYTLLPYYHTSSMCILCNLIYHISELHSVCLCVCVCVFLYVHLLAMPYSIWFM